MTIDNDIGILQRRKIEAEIVKPIYNIIQRDFSTETAQNIIQEAIANAAKDAGKAFAQQEINGVTTIDTFAALQPLWTKDDALTLEVTTQTEHEFTYTVTRCKYAELYQSMGLADIGFLLSCNRDAKFIEGYAPHITLTRPHTIMKGDGFCDFCYTTSTSDDE